MARKIESLVGRKFGKLTVLERAEDYIVPKTKQHQFCWLCQCECGNQKVVRGSTLKNGKTTSCGCVHKEVVKKIGIKNKKTNNYDLSGEYGIGYTHNGREFYFDLEDYDLIKDYSWSMDKAGYVIGSPSKNRKQIHLHVLVMNPDSKQDVDHINHNPSDNRKINLRNVTRSQNQMNVGLSRNNKSGITGVHFDSTNEKWVAQIGIDRKRKNLGKFDNFDDAVKARREAEKKYFGEYRYKEQQDVKHMSAQEMEEYDELYQYVRCKIMGYDENQSLSSKMALRLKGLKVNKFIENKAIADTANYSYKLILTTFKFCSVEIDRAFRSKNFKDEMHKFNYALTIVESNLNTVYTRMKNAVKAEEKTQTMDVKTATHTGASYQRKTKETSSNLEELW